MNVQWYPGHMTKALRQIKEDIKLIDLVIELTDARAPLSGRNPDIDSLAAGKSRILLLNKADLADEQQNKAWMAYFEQQGILSACINSQKGQGMRQIQPLIDKACKEKFERDRKRGIMNRPVRALIAGIPNVGKSTFINSLSGRSAAKTGNKPGVTKGKQWIRLNKQVELLDTPGILWPKFDDPAVGTRLALIGSVKDEITAAAELVMPLIEYLQKNYPGTLEKRYGLEESYKDNLDMIRAIAKARGCLMKGEAYDLDRAAALVIEDFRKIRLGRITLETPLVSDANPEDASSSENL